MNEQKSDDLAVWDSVASSYQEFSQDDLLRNEILLPALFDMVGNPNNQNIADLGCGDGSIAAKLCGLGAHVSACDGAPDFILQAKKNLRQCAKNALLSLHDLREPIKIDEHYFPAKSFDIVLTNMVISSLPDLVPLLESSKQLLKPEGRLIITTLHPAFTPPAAKVRAGITGRLIPRLRSIYVLNYFLERRVDKTFQGGKVPPVPYRHRTLTTLFNALRQAGFAVTNLQEPSPGKESKVAKSTATIHALKAPIFLLIEAKIL